MSHKEKLVVRSFQQSYLIPTPVKPFTRDLILHLRHTNINETDSNHIKGLEVEQIKRKFVTNERLMKKVIRESNIGTSMDGLRCY